MRQKPVVDARWDAPESAVGMYENKNHVDGLRFWECSEDNWWEGGVRDEVEIVSDMSGNVVDKQDH